MDARVKPAHDAVREAPLNIAHKPHHEVDNSWSCS